MVDAPADKVIIGHYTTKNGWVNDAVVSKVINAGTTYTLGVTLKGSTVSVTLDGQAVVGFVFNAATVDGNFGLLAAGGNASFDDVRVRTNDRAFVAAGGANLIATASAAESTQAGAALTQDQLDGVVAAAISQWTDLLGAGDTRLAAFGGMSFTTANLAGQELGHAQGKTILIDFNAAGYGWFVDATPDASSEFKARSGLPLLVASPDGGAAGRMDLLTVVLHELGHVLGFEHGDSQAPAVMYESLDLGVRYLLGAPCALPLPLPLESVLDVTATLMPGLHVWDGPAGGDGRVWHAAVPSGAGASDAAINRLVEDASTIARSVALRTALFQSMLAGKAGLAQLR